MITADLIAKATQKAQNAQVLLVQKETTEIAFENDILKSVESSQSTNISVTVVVDGLLGTSQTTDINDPDGVVNRALEVAEFGNVCQYDLPGYRPGKSVKVFDETLVPFNKLDMIQTGCAMQDAIRTYNSNLVFRGGLKKSIIKKAFANSRGANFTEESTDFMIWGLGQRIRENTMFEAWTSTHSKQLNNKQVGIADRVVKMMKNAENDAQIQSGPIPVIFAPVSMDVLMLPLRLALDGKHVFTGYSSMGGKIGHQIVDKHFSVTDHPLIDYGPRSSSYDDEGVPRQKLPLIENGVVRNFLYDLDSAGQAGTQSTGHGAGRDTTNLLIQPGTAALADIVENTRRGLIIYYVLGLGQGNPVSGDFSVGIRLGYKIENGQIVGLVNDIMLAGNVFHALNNIIAISKETEPVFGWYEGFYPYIQVDGLEVTAR